MVSINPTKIKDNERGVLSGRTGSGKSTLAKYLIMDKVNLVIIDIKGDFEPINPKYATATTPEELQHSKKGGPVLYRPSPEFSEPDNLDAVFKWIYYREHTFVYIDELTATLRSAVSFPRWLQAIVQQGRGKDIGFLGCTQRPANVPPFIFSEAEKLWTFKLRLPQDIERMAEYMGPEIETQGWSKEHSFWFYDIHQEHPVEKILKLPTQIGGKTT